MSLSQATKVGVPVSVIVAALLAILGWFANEEYSDYKTARNETRAEIRSLHDIAASVSERVARLESRQTNIANHIIWKDGDNEYTAAIKEEQ